MQTCFLVNAALPDRGLADSADIYVTCMRGDLERHLQGNVATGMNVRGDVNVHANIQIRELSIDQWADAPRSNTRREGARGNGYPVSNFQGGLFVV